MTSTLEPASQAAGEPDGADAPFWWSISIESRGGTPVILTFDGSCGQAYLNAGEARAIALALNNAADEYDRAQQRPGLKVFGGDTTEVTFRHGQGDG